MGMSTAAFMIIIMVVGLFAGWHARRAQSANADLKVYKSRIPGFRRVRLRSGLIAAALVVLMLLALRDLVG